MSMRVFGALAAVVFVLCATTTSHALSAYMASMGMATPGKPIPPGTADRSGWLDGIVESCSRATVKSCMKT